MLYLVFVVVQALIRARVNAGALCSTGAALYALTLPVRFRRSLLQAGADYVARYLMMTLERSGRRSVLIECARAGWPSMAMIGMRRPCSWPSRVSCASERKLFFSSSRWGWGSERGRAPAVRAVILSVWKKNGLQKSEGCGTVGV